MSLKNLEIESLNSLAVEEGVCSCYGAEGQIPEGQPLLVATSFLVML
jgi:hypothetical protein